jgi:predicted nucleic acid-binding protein
VILFLDSSVLLSAASSEKSLSRFIVTLATSKGWELITAAYCRDEVNRNIVKFGADAIPKWEMLTTRLKFTPNALTSKGPLLLTASKDKPVLISALAAKSYVLLTLDQKDFAGILNTEVYGMFVATPKGFLIRQGLAP